jgi:hypothetical protein
MRWVAAISAALFTVCTPRWSTAHLEVFSYVFDAHSTAAQYFLEQQCAATWSSPQLLPATCLLAVRGSHRQPACVWSRDQLVCVISAVSLIIACCFSELSPRAEQLCELPCSVLSRRLTPLCAIHGGSSIERHALPAAMARKGLAHATNEAAAVPGLPCTVLPIGLWASSTIVGPLSACDLTN